MALIEIEYGSLASSETMNSNFTYLQNLISGLNETIISNNAGINSNIASINNSISTMQETIEADIENTGNNIMAQFSSNGMFVTTYINGSSWYREYFSDKEKKNRVWLEQGGITENWNSANHTINLLKSFNNTNYSVLFTPHGTNIRGYAITVSSKTVSNFVIIQGLATNEGVANASYNSASCWYACGK